MTSREISTGLTCDAQYFEIYNCQYIKILCIYSQYLNILFFAVPANCVKNLSLVAELLILRRSAANNWQISTSCFYFVE